METNEAVQLLQKALNIKFSDEQLKVIHHDFATPTLINACAGSGKTTTFILIMLTKILTGQKQPEDILGITFSKKAQLDMEERYENYVAKLNAIGVSLPTDTKPDFKTFHALFYNLLKRLPNYRNLNVLESYHYWQLPLLNMITHDDDEELSDSDYLDRIFADYGNLFNLTATTDGLTIINGKYAGTKVADLSSNQFFEITGKSATPLYLKNYVAVIEKYRQLKMNENTIDFMDMQILLATATSDRQTRQFIKRLMDHFSMVIVDEFQDINQIQLLLLKRILSSQTYNTLSAIGDDDQAIYSFRGSNPTYILNFKKKLFPNQDVTMLNLSTNYRTGGNILSFADNVISNNIIRLPKTLKAFNEDTGEINVIKQETKFNDNDPFFKSLLEACASDESVGILVRHNTDHIIIKDWLTNHNITANSNNDMSLQGQNAFYKDLIGLLSAFWHNDLNNFTVASNKIGFSRYKAHVQKLTAQHNFKTLLQYSAFASNYLDSDEPSFAKSIQMTDRKVNQLLNQIVDFRQFGDDEHEILLIIWQEVQALTLTYYDYMFKKHYRSMTEYNQVVDYLSAAFKPVTNINDFLRHEARKLNTNSLDNHVQIMTLHQSKGLEFDQVFLYNLSNRSLSQTQYSLYVYFKNLRRYAFEDHDIRQEVLPRFNNILGDLVYELGFNKFKATLLNLHIPAVTSIFHNLPDKMSTGEFFNRVANDEELALTLYQIIKTNSDFVEEERRLLYVGMTRAKKTLVIDENVTSKSPLLDEI